MREPLVFLPGFMCDARVFGPQVLALSADTPVMVAPVTIGERVEEIASALMSALPAKFALAGLGFGGIVAMEVMRRAPERVLRVALMDTTPLAETPQEAAAREARLVKARTGRLVEALEEELRLSGLAVSPDSAEVRAMALDMGLHLGAEVYARQTRAAVRRRDQQAVMRKCKVPAMVMCGAENVALPVKRHQFLSTLIPYARLKVIEGAGHMSPMEQPEAVIEALRDWQKQPFVLQ
ncbi:alpha/beta fold hydrolase [Marinovum sp. 2_MG-2023]|uniref:alpha/beta fold hydrolase n=1 Tax=unclassified Marinovum TaxID=2647166 RepID=UPI0026E2A9E3|nr:MULTISPECIES: alpha/beta fold hydrolase [unclassified Marinovum]MDO6728899.1 alpha/beta fold hydrolase [Marinovum sp. 2_MG-2023]MDO6777685.1 alpha/beta fold hydrolase [Marinovum sp. 1_MG-2023]